MHDNMQDRVCAACESAYCTANRPTDVPRVPGIAGGNFCPRRFLSSTTSDGSTQLDGGNELCLECFTTVNNLYGSMLYDHAYGYTDPTTGNAVAATK
jgi:hypothetical protein